MSGADEGGGGDVKIQNPLTDNDVDTVESAAQDGEEAPRPMSIRENIYQTFEDPVSSPVAVGVMICLNCLILVSTTTFVLETMAQFRDVSEDSWFLIETICIIGFTTDFVLRMLCCPDCGAFWGEFMNMVDFVAIVPYYVEIIIAAVSPGVPIPQYLRVIRVVRLARILRIIAMTKAGKMAAVIAKIAITATQSLIIPCYFLFLCVIMYSSAMFYFEKGEFVTCEAMGSEWAEGVVKDWDGLKAKPELEYHFCDKASAFPFYEKIFPPNAASCAVTILSTCTETAGTSVAEDAAACLAVDSSGFEQLAQQRCNDVLTKASDDNQDDSGKTVTDLLACTFTAFDPDKTACTGITGAALKTPTACEALLTAASDDFQEDANKAIDDVLACTYTPAQVSSYECDPNTATCCFCIPNGNYLDAVKYTSIPDAFWWVMVTVTTVGYGDLFPITWMGRGIGILTMMTGVFFLAMPLTIVGTKFNSAWEDLEHERHEVDEEENKQSRQKSHVKLQELAVDFRDQCKGFCNEYVGKSDPQKLALFKDKLLELRAMQDEVTSNMEQCFELYNIGVMDINMQKEIDTVAEATGAADAAEAATAAATRRQE